MDAPLRVNSLTHLRNYRVSLTSLTASVTLEFGDLSSVSAAATSSRTSS